MSTQGYMLYSFIKRVTPAKEELLHHVHEGAVQAALSFLPSCPTGWISSGQFNMTVKKAVLSFTSCLHG